MRIFFKQTIVGFQYLVGGALFLLLSENRLPQTAINVVGISWFLYTAYRLATIKCPHCDKPWIWGPLPYSPLAPACRTCGVSVFKGIDHGA